jgi:hypothetical protein
MTEAVEETKDLTVGNPETFMGEIEEMDLSELKDKTFFVAISTGKRESALFLAPTIRGPYSFMEMVREVNNTWKEQLLHAHVLIPQKERSEPNEFLDECTIDFIEARAEDIMIAAWLDDSLDSPLGKEPYTCKAGFISDEVAKKEDDEETDEQD